MSAREDRIVAASFALQGLIACDHVEWSAKMMATMALEYADALLAKINETTPDPDA